MTQRRYTDDEIAEIFRRATRRGSPGDAGDGGTSLAPARPEGLSLAELQEIGREVGIEPAEVARSAAALELPSEEGRVTRRAAGAPLALARRTQLPRALTETEWTHLVSEVRDVFDARGTVRDEGPFREWTNGNLHVVLEPTPEGERLSIRTRKSGGEVPIYFGGFMLILAAVTAVAGLITGLPAEQIIRTSGILGFLGAGGVGVGAAGLRIWARERLGQMEAVAETAALLAAGPGEDRDDPGDGEAAGVRRGRPRSS